MKKVLVVANAFQNGGISNLFYSINSKINRNEYEFDYLYTMSLNRDFEDSVFERFEDIGAKKFVISSPNQKAIRWRYDEFVQLFQTIKNGKYDVIHVNQCRYAMSCILLAKIMGIKVRIVHSHSVPESLTTKEKVFNIIGRFIFRVFATVRLGCSKQACDFMFGRFADTHILYNGIDREKFNPCIYDRNNILQKYGLSGECEYFVFVGRFSYQKNPIYMLNVFKHIHSERMKSRLLIIGHGELYEEMKREIDILGIAEYVQFFPHDSSVPELLSVSDYFIMPSRFEGLGIAFIEAQMMGLETFASDRVPVEAHLGKLHRLSIVQNPKEYADCVLQIIDRSKSTLNQIDAAKYDISNTIECIGRLYNGDKL